MAPDVPLPPVLPAPPSPTPAWEAIARHVDRPVVVAHRGGATHAPENTLAAYRAAIAGGATLAETDIHMSADGVPVVIHDPTTDRTTGVSGRVAERTWAELAPLDAGRWFAPEFAGESLPTLGALLDVTHDTLVLCIEIKEGVGLVEAVAREVDARGMRGQVIVFSFDPAALAGIRSAMPDVPTLLLASHTPTPPRYDRDAVLSTAAAVGAAAVGFSHKLVTAELVEAAHTAGLPVFTWTVNLPEDVARVRALGVDGIISDAPAEVAAWLD
jgi:glycerophosphoryl diester phosphodiesterase